MKSILIPFVLLCLSSNGQNNNSQGNYYFPSENFLKEKTYVFINANDSAEKSYWKMKTTIINGDTTFQTSIIKNNILTEKITEKIKNGNSKILNYTTYYKNDSSTCTILDSLVYKSDQNIGEEIKWVASFKDFTSPAIISLSKTRKLKSEDKLKQVYTDKMKITRDNSPEMHEYSLEFVYEKGKGLVSYTFIISDSLKREFKLSEVIPENE